MRQDLQDCSIRSAERTAWATQAQSQHFVDGWEIWMHLVHKPAGDVTVAVTVFYIQSIGERLLFLIRQERCWLLALLCFALFCLIVDTVVVYLTQSPGLVV